MFSTFRDKEEAGLLQFAVIQAMDVTYFMPRLKIYVALACAPLQRQLSRLPTTEGYACQTQGLEGIYNKVSVLQGE